MDKLLKFRTAAPLVGGIGLIVCFILSAFGYADFAAGLQGALQLFGAADASPITTGDITTFASAVGSALALGVGIFRKLKASLSKPKA